MTALDRFVRLESGGIWREDADAQRRDVTVSFGKTTLVLADGAGRALTHWSLPAVLRLNPGARPAIYAPDKDAAEALEIEDDLMVDAIEEVRKALRVATPKRGRVRGYLTASTAAICAVALALWAPGAMRDTAVTVLPDSARQTIGATILGHYQRLTGAACQTGPGTAVLAQLHTQLFGPDAPGQLVVVQDLPQGAVALPGDLIMIDRRLVEGSDDPAVLAGFVMAADAAAPDALRSVLDSSALRATMTLLTTGDLPDHTLRTQAVALHQAATPPDPEMLKASFAAAATAPTPARPAQGATLATYATSPTGQPLLDDNAWVRLQNICQ